MLGKYAVNYFLHCIFWFVSVLSELAFFFIVFSHNHKRHYPQIFSRYWVVTQTFADHDYNILPMFETLYHFFFFQNKGCRAVNVF